MPKGDIIGVSSGIMNFLKLKKTQKIIFLLGNPSQGISFKEN